MKKLLCKIFGHEWIKLPLETASNPPIGELYCARCRVTAKWKGEEQWLDVEYKPKK